MKTSRRAKRPPRVIRSLAALRPALADFRARGRTIALVPTMGALHEGHFSLVHRAQSRADCVIVSIFVNPTQFAPHEDLTTYPRSFAADLAALAERQVAVVWAPEVKTMYPSGFATRVVPGGPAMVGLEDVSRPHFFAGVATVVTKLLIQCQPDIALFGEKDYQQLKMVEQLVRDLGLRTRIVAGPIVRERDGLALSSRNRYLSLNQRLAAPALYRALKDAAAKIGAGAPITDVVDKASATIAQAGLELDYFEVRNAETLEALKASAGEPIRLLTAARIGRTRLIDNIAV